MLESESVDILGISESWLHSDIDDGELNISGYYNIIRNDRVANRYGGVAIYCKKGGYKHINRRELNISHIETAWIEISYNKLDPLSFVLYTSQKTVLHWLWKYYRNKSAR